MRVSLPFPLFSSCFDVVPPRHLIDQIDCSILVVKGNGLNESRREKWRPRPTLAEQVDRIIQRPAS